MLEQYSIVPRCVLPICYSDAPTALIERVDRLESVTEVGQLAALTQPGDHVR